jgi:hypothetical protein
VALVGAVIASHYAEPVQRLIAAETPLLSAPAGDAAVIREMSAGDAFDMLDDSLGWAWGYAGEDRRVGYVRSESLRSI